MTVTRRLTLPTGLSQAAAAKEATKRIGGDWRGFKYDPRTGKASVC